jgi:hypothetical protein
MQGVDLRPQDCPVCSLVTALTELSAAAVMSVELHHLGAVHTPLYVWAPVQDTSDYQTAGLNRLTAPDTIPVLQLTSQFLFQTLCAPINIQPHNLEIRERGGAGG